MAKITKVGFQALLEQRDQLSDLLRAKTKEMGEAARRDPDLPENPEFMALKMEITFTIPKQLEVIDSKLMRAEIIDDEATPGVISIGSRVRLRVEGEEAEYLIGSGANVAQGVLSHESPMAQAINGLKAGSVVSFISPRGKSIEVEVLFVGDGGGG